MPIDYSKYHKDWKTKIRPRILKRAEHKCEKCGVENYALIVRSAKDKSKFVYFTSDYDDDYLYRTSDNIPIRLSELPVEYWENNVIKIVLTIAHLDRDITNNDNDNLMALCQRCHLTHDAKANARKAAITKRRKRDEMTGQQRMFDDWQNIKK